MSLVNTFIRTYELVKLFYRSIELLVPLLQTTNSTLPLVELVIRDFIIEPSLYSLYTKSHSIT